MDDERDLRRALSHRRLERDVDDEIEAHFEGTVDLLVSRGLSEEEARAEVRRRFGDPTRYRRELVRIGRRRLRRRRAMGWTDSFRGAARFAWRSVRRAPRFAAAVASTLALGIGANAVMFELVDRLVLSPPPVLEAPEELRRPWIRRPDDSGVRMESPYFAYPGYRDLAADELLPPVAAYATGARLTLGDGLDAQRVRVVQVSGSYFPLLGARPALGRLLDPGDDRADAPPVAVLSHAFWRRASGGDSTVLGEVLHLGDGRYEVVGVTPASFTGVEHAPVDVWLPLLPSGIAEDGDGWIGNRGWWWLRLVTRVDGTSSLPGLETRMTSAHRAGYADLPGYPSESAEVFTAPLVAARGPEPDREARVALWLAGLSLLVLAVTCANVANLFLAMAERRRRELAVRVALGVGRGRLLAALLAETLLLTGTGAAAALALALWGGPALQGVLAPELGPEAVAPGGRLLLFTVAAAGLAMLLAGVVPALRATRIGASGVLPSGGRGGGGAGAGVRSTLVALQVGLSVVLLVGAGLFLRSLDEAREVDPGFDADRVAILRLEPGDEPTESSADLYRRVEQTLPRLPEVVSAARVVSVPFRSTFGLTVHVPELDSAPRRPESGPAAIDAVGAGYFETMGVRILEGRGIREDDVGEGSEPVAVVSRVMAEHVWGPRGALGRCVHVGGPESLCSRIVGVAEDMTLRELDEAPRMIVWLAQGNEAIRGVGALAVRLDPDAGDALDAVRAEVASVAPAVRYVDVGFLSEPLGGLLRSWRLGASVLSAFGVLAWLVAGIGIYSLLAFEVARQRREIGIRKALGASRARTTGAVVLRGLRLVAAGLALGLGAAWVAGDVVGPLLFEVSPRSPEVYALAASALLAVALLASAVPALRAVRADAMESIRAD